MGGPTIERVTPVTDEQMGTGRPTNGRFRRSAEAHQSIAAFGVAPNRSPKPGREMAVGWN